MTDSSPIGLYLHIPFCRKKCAYCDFYSCFADQALLDRYTACLTETIARWGERLDRPVDTVYFGGGTPSLLGDRLLSVMDAVRTSFRLAETSEITMEMNPSGSADRLLEAAARAGINRLSIGAQSGSDEELALLGRTHTAKETVSAVRTARRLGFRNLSLDLMLGLPASDTASLKKTLAFLCSLEPEHISAYLLKIEGNTAFSLRRHTLALPDDDAQAEQYLFMCRYLESAGFDHYEISSFAKNGQTGKHNMKYWLSEEYLGLGPSAHSFLNGKRFFYPRDLKAFLRGEPPCPDGDGGSLDEAVMLRLRLSEGLGLTRLQERLGKELPPRFSSVCSSLEKAGLLRTDGRRIALTDSGMLVSNSIITELLGCLA